MDVEEPDVVVGEFLPVFLLDVLPAGLSGLLELLYLLDVDLEDLLEVVGDVGVIAAEAAVDVALVLRGGRGVGKRGESLHFLLFLAFSRSRDKAAGRGKDGREEVELGVAVLRTRVLERKQEGPLVDNRVRRVAAFGGDVFIEDTAKAVGADDRLHAAAALDIDLLLRRFERVGHRILDRGVEGVLVELGPVVKIGVLVHELELAREEHVRSVPADTVEGPPDGEDADVIVSVIIRRAAAVVGD